MAVVMLALPEGCALPGGGHLTKDLYMVHSMYEDHHSQCFRAGLRGFSGVCPEGGPEGVGIDPGGDGTVSGTAHAAADFVAQPPSGERGRADPADHGRRRYTGGNAR